MGHQYLDWIAGLKKQTKKTEEGGETHRQTEIFFLLVFVFENKAEVQRPASKAFTDL